MWDKGVGTVSIIGIPFNIAFAKALTWRLGAWFGLLSALGEECNSNDLLIRSTMQLIREIFPSVGRVFNFKAPDEHAFVTLIASLDGLTRQTADERTKRALDVLGGKGDDN